MSIYLSDATQRLAEQAVAKRERAFAARQKEAWDADIAWDFAKVGDDGLFSMVLPPMEPQAAVDARWERVGEIILWVLFLLICAGAGWAYAHGGWR